MAERLWFTTAHLTILLLQAQTADGIWLIEHHMARDFAIPLRVRTLDAGEAVRVAAGVAHSFRIVPPEARFLTMTNGRFEAMIRSLARPAER